MAAGVRVWCDTTTILLSLSRVVWSVSGRAVERSSARGRAVVALSRLRRRGRCTRRTPCSVTACACYASLRCRVVVVATRSFYSAISTPGFFCAIQLHSRAHLRYNYIHNRRQNDDDDGVRCEIDVNTFTPPHTRDVSAFDVASCCALRGASKLDN